MTRVFFQTPWLSTASAGLGLLQFCNLNSFRTKFILGFSLFIGLSISQYFNEYLLVSGHGPVHTQSTWVSVYLICMLFPCSLIIIRWKQHVFFLLVTQFNNVMQTIFSSPATVAIMVAFFLDCTHSYWHDSIRRDNGSHWWEKFRSFNADTRTENFYSLPANLNRFFPSFLNSISFMDEEHKHQW